MCFGKLLRTLTNLRETCNTLLVMCTVIAARFCLVLVALKKLEVVTIRKCIYYIDLSGNFLSNLYIYVNELYNIIICTFVVTTWL